MIGSIKHYNEPKGFGFIVPQDGSKELFFHVSELAEGYVPKEGDTVNYTEGSGKDGRPAAKAVSSSNSIESFNQVDDEME